MKLFLYCEYSTRGNNAVFSEDYEPLWGQYADVLGGNGADNL